MSVITISLFQYCDSEFGGIIMISYWCLLQGNAWSICVLVENETPWSGADALIFAESNTTNVFNHLHTTVQTAADSVTSSIRLLSKISVTQCQYNQVLPQKPKDACQSYNKLSKENGLLVYIRIYSIMSSFHSFFFSVIFIQQDT